MTIEAKVDAHYDELSGRIDNLALACQKEFTAIHEEFAGIHKELADIHEAMKGMVTKQDLYHMEARILDAFKDVAVEIKSLSARVLVLERIVKP